MRLSQLPWLAAPLAVPTSLSPAPLVPADLIVLLGQSNAVGYGRVESLPAPLQKPQSGAWIWVPRQRAWQRVEAGKNSHDVPDVPFFGPEVGIAARFAHRRLPVWVVKLAVAHSAMGPLDGGDNEWAPSGGELYPRLLRRVEDAAAVARTFGLVPRVRLVLIAQGETDSRCPELAAIYERLLTELCNQLRFDLITRRLAAVDGPHIRLALVHPGFARRAESTAVVRAAQRAVAARLPKCECVTTTDLTVTSDGELYDAAALLRLGREFVAPGW